MDTNPTYLTTGVIRSPRFTINPQLLLITYLCDRKRKGKLNLAIKCDWKTENINLSNHVHGIIYYIVTQ